MKSIWNGGQMARGFRLCVRTQAVLAVFEAQPVGQAVRVPIA